MRFSIAVALFLVSSIAHALIIEPVVLEMTTDQQAAIVVSNSSNKEIAVDIQALEIEFAKNNTQKEVDNELLIFPPAFILKAGAKQNVRLIWNADKNMRQARSFYIRFETPVLQPITKSNTSAIDIQIDYNALVHISQKGHQPRLRLTKQSINDQHLELEIFNGGQKYDFLEFYELQNKNLIFSNEKLREVLGNVFFPPFSTSNLSIPLSLLPKDFEKKKSVSLVRKTKQ